MARLNRREFVVGVGAAAMTLPAMAATGRTGFVGSSGRRLFGLLTTALPAEHDRALAILRREQGYRRPLTYASTDKNKLAFAIGAIDYASRCDMAFVLVDRKDIPLLQSPDGYPELTAFAAFLTGCAYGDRTGTRHPLKRALIEALKARGTLA